jgi:quaternary ammonium compound-resistance protein SugE
VTVELGGVAPWTLVVLAGLLEIVWAIGFKYVREDAPFILHAGVFAALAMSFILLVAALRQLPAGTAYAVWTGIGASGVAIVGMIAFGEPATPARIIFIGLIIAGIVGLRLAA